ncbi:MAG: hypothetical protein IKR59_04285 [Lachnospiraceae bacterium]|nr:hypothetical protein [Lachnospiraceae bacterium]
MEQKADHHLETEPIGTLMREYAVPGIISLLVAALCNGALSSVPVSDLLTFLIAAFAIRTTLRELRMPSAHESEVRLCSGPVN